MSRRRKLLVGVVTGCLILITAISLLLHQWLGGTDNGTVHVGTSPGPVTPAETVSIINTPYFTTLLPPGFIIKRQTATPQGPATLLQLVADTPSTTSEQFAATVGVLPVEGWNAVGDYNVRATQTGSYTPYSPISLPAGAIAFRSTNGPVNFTVFWQHQGRYVELSYSSDGGASLQQLENVFEQTIAQWHWL